MCYTYYKLHIAIQSLCVRNMRVLLGVGRQFLLVSLSARCSEQGHGRLRETAVSERDRRLKEPQSTDLFPVCRFATIHTRIHHTSRFAVNKLNMFHRLGIQRRLRVFDFSSLSWYSAILNLTYRWVTTVLFYFIEFRTILCKISVTDSRKRGWLRALAGDYIIVPRQQAVLYRRTDH